MWKFYEQVVKCVVTCAFSGIDEQVVEDVGQFLTNDCLLVGVERLILAASDDWRLSHAQVAELRRAETLSSHYTLQTSIHPVPATLIPMPSQYPQPMNLHPAPSPQLSVSL